MPIEHINKTDTLNEGREKLNAAIDGANAADVTSKAADTKATQALTNSESTQTQLDTIVIDGDSSVEAAQARVDEKGVPHPTLKARIDDGLNSVNQQLAQTPNVKMFDDVASAFNSFPNGKVRLYFPDGNYSFKNIEIKEDTEIVLSNGAICEAPIDALDSDSFFKVIGTESNRIPNVTLIGGQFEGFSRIGNIISAENVENVKIFDVKANNLLSSGFIIRDGGNAHVSNNIVDEAHMGISIVNVENVSVKDNIISNTEFDSILIYTTSQSVNVTGNKCSNFIKRYEAGRGGIQIYDAFDVSVSDNFCWNDDTLQTQGRIAIRVRDCMRVSVNGNKIKNVSHAGIEIIRLADVNVEETKEIIVVNNNITNVKSNGIIVTHGSSVTGLGECIVMNNFINGVGYINSGSAGSGITIRGSNKTKVGSNIIKNTDSNGININGNYVDILSNTIENTGLETQANNKEGIFLSGENLKCLFNTVIDTQETTTMSYSVRQYNGNAQIFGNTTSKPNWVQGIVLPIESPVTNINTIPQYVGQVGVVNGLAYIATGVSSGADWKQITN